MLQKYLFPSQDFWIAVYSTVHYVSIKTQHNILANEPLVTFGHAIQELGLVFQARQAYLSSSPDNVFWQAQDPPPNIW